MRQNIVSKETQHLKDGKTMNGLGKLPPQAIDLEEAVLGAILIEKDAINEVLGIISPNSFYKDSHAHIYESCLNLFRNNEPIDLLTVTNDLKKNGKLQLVGGAYYLTDLTSKVSSSLNIQHHARIIEENSMKRSLIRLAIKITQESFDESSDVFELIEEMSTAIVDINSSFDNSKSNPVRHYLPEVLEDIKNASKTKDHLTGIDTGIPLMNSFTGGWQNTDLIIVAARPSMGKTDVAINEAMNAAKTGKKVAFFSLEMSGKQITRRVLSIETEIYRNKVKTGKLNELDWKRITTMKNEVLDNILIQDNPSLSAIKFHSICKMLKIKSGIDMVILDYMQLMSGNKKGNRETEVSDISRTCKLVAMELNVPVIALSQLSRAVETRGGDRRPQLSDLRESGAIEQDANLVIFPYRPEKYGIDADEDGNSTENLMEFIFAKQRDGAVGVVKTKYLDSIGRIYSIDDPINHHKEPEPDKFITSGIDDFEPKKDKAPF